MSYTTKTKTQFKALTKQTDEQLADIVPKDAYTVQEMIDLNKSSNGRFTYTLDPSGLVASIRWSNYVYISSKYRIDDDTKAAEITSGSQIVKVVS